MSEAKQPIITDEDIQKALRVLDELDGGEQVTEQKPQVVNESEKIGKSENPTIGGISEDIFKSAVDDINSKFVSLAKINKYLVDENEALQAANVDLVKSMTEAKGLIEKSNSTLERVAGLVEQMANSPINKLASFTKSVQVDKFGQEQDADGKEVISLSANKPKVVGMLLKSLETEEAQKRLGDVTALIENGFVNSDNFHYVKKSLENEFGGNYKFVM